MRQLFFKEMDSRKLPNVLRDSAPDGGLVLSSCARPTRRDAARTLLGSFCRSGRSLRKRSEFTPRGQLKD